MVRWLLIPLFLPILHAETFTLSLKEAVDRALRQNADIALARIDEQKAALNIRVMKDPFSPKLGAGSGLAYTNGFPMSIEGSGPSVLTMRATEYLYNKPQSYLVAQAKENARGAGFTAGAKTDEVTYRVVSLYLDADRARRLRDLAAKQIDQLSRIASTIAARVEEGRELPIENRRAQLNILKAKQRVDSLAAEQDLAEHQLALVAGLTPDDRVRTTDSDRQPPDAPATEAAALELALSSNKEIRRIESEMISKGLEAKSNQAYRYPRVDLVAQYGLFANFNHYSEYFNNFRRNNAELGASFQIPLLPGQAARAYAAIAEGEAAHLRIEKNQLRNRIALDIHQAYLESAKAQSARELAQADLALAREELSIVLAQAGEGRAAMRQVEQARLNEEEKWSVFYDADASVERAKFNILRFTGEIVAALR